LHPSPVGLRPGTVVGRYEVVRCASSCVLGQVYAGFDREGHRKVVLVVDADASVETLPEIVERIAFGSSRVCVFHELPAALEDAVGANAAALSVAESPQTTRYQQRSSQMAPTRVVAPTVSMVRVRLVDTPSAAAPIPAVRDEPVEPFPALGERFALQRKLAQGGFGEVYEAFDRERQTAVAIKRLRRWGGTRLRRFKQEFRQIAGLRHPHLVKCYELFLHDDEAFFTMELVHGFSLLDWLRTTRPAPSTLLGEGAAADDSVTEPVPATRRVDFRLIRRVALELSRALEFLHERGKLHRDVKPSNVMLDGSGRVVLLDFGLLLAHDDDALDEVNLVVGTPRYMAPEQLLRVPLTSAVDLYQMGLVLFEMLTGVLPWRGTGSTAWPVRLAADAVAPSSVAECVPADLDQLVAALLRCDPAQRPSAAQVVAALDVSTTSVATPRPLETPLIGRDVELERLHDLVGQNPRAVVLVEGPSGMGKSSLVNAFCRMFAEQGESAVLLSGRCFEWETIPFNAFDAINDSLVTLLHRLVPSESATILGDDLEDVVQLFPVFSELLADPGQGRRAASLLSNEARRQSLIAYRSMLGRLAQRRRVLVVIDDLQWGDADSAKVLLDLLQRDERPPITVLAACRSERAASVPCVDALGRCGAVSLSIGPLQDADARTLCHALGTPLPESAIDAIVSEARGQPFFIAELARRMGDAESPSSASLDELIHLRAREISASARKLLAVTATVARPVARRVVEAASQAATLGPLTDAWTELSMGRWVRAERLGEHDLVECYHDRIRESVAAMFDNDERRRMHADIAEALEAHQPSHVEALSVHFLAASLPERAYPYTVEAAKLAQQSMAFEYAAGLYRAAAESAPSAEERLEHLQCRAKALASAGHGKEAADLYLQLAEVATTESSLRLRRLAAEQLVSTGHVRDGVGVLKAVLHELGVAVPQTRLGVLTAHVFQSTWISLRGWSLPRRDTPADLRELAVIDCLRVLGALMSLIDPLVSAYFVRRHARLAIRAAEPHRAAQALAEEATYISTGGSPTLSLKEAQLFARAQRMASELGDDELKVRLDALLGVSHICHSDWDGAERVFRSCEHRILRAHPGLTWELNQARLYRLYAMRNLGAWKEVASAAETLIDDAFNRQDRYAEATYRTFLGDLQPLLDDDPEAAIETMNIALARWERHDYDIIRVTAYEGICNAVLYRERGEGPGALEKVRTYWREMKRSGTWFVQVNRIVWQDIRARGLLAAAAAARGSTRTRLHRQAARDARALDGSGVNWGRGCAERLWAAVAVGKGRVPEALAHLQRAEHFFMRAGMKLMVAAVRWRRSQLLGHGEDEELAVARMEGAKNPTALLASLVPGRWGTGS